ncbi:ribokinase [Paraburkholderia sp. JPY432]|uniref:ribokinase n=1 Tax=Paraburkholderia youngii TaxID=2782701 RepID=UPI00159529F3|nr:ribokinase [Paraburkholderia youngii]NVH76661.1 ribokinase [Paraburkholderia youngii]
MHSTEASSSVRLIVAGSANMDLVVHAERLPARGETLLGGAFATFAGGKGANQAVAAARLGASVAMLGCIGDDDFGAQLRARLDREHIDTAHLQMVNDMSTGIAAITVAADGANTIVVSPGANAALTPAHVDAAQDAIGAAGMLICQLEVPLDTVRHAISVAGRLGTPVLLNPAPAQPLADALYQQVSYMVLNETEAHLLTDVPVDGPASAREAAAHLRAKGVETVIVTLGAEGVWYATTGEEGHLPAPRVDAIDTTAAGDTFVGGFAAERVRGASIRDAIEFGQRAAALSVTRQGAQASIPTQAEVRAQPAFPATVR